MLPKALGKTFYKSTAKRPIPVSIAAPAPRSEGKKIARAKTAEKTSGTPAAPKAIAAEIEKAVQSALVHISPSVSTAVRIGYANMKPEELAANVEVVVNEMVEKLVTKKWRNVKGIYIKGKDSAALPIWLADELWVDETDVLDDESAAKLKVEANVGKKRKAVEAAPVEEKTTKDSKKQKLLESNDDNLDKEIASRKEKLKKQKADAAKSADVEDVVPRASKRTKKGKAVVA